MKRMRLVRQLLCTAFGHRPEHGQYATGWQANETLDRSQARNYTDERSLLGNSSEPATKSGAKPRIGRAKN